MGEDFTFNYDELRRLSSVVGSKYSKSYDYRNISTTNTTSQVAALTYSGFSNAPAFGHTYDALGNISRYTDPTGTQVYRYDAQNQLTKVEDANGNVLYQYSYDNAGNILSANGHSYVYSTGLWKDQLASFDGVAFEYDAIGNPTSYYNGTSYTFAWEEGRNLVSAVSGSNTYTYAYDSSGLRTSKTVNGVTHNYLYAGGSLLRETYGDIILDFVYGHNGHPFALRYTANGTTSTYYYITNLQGDVLYLLNSDKQTVASYAYDPYGKPLDYAEDGTIAAINPLRYRGYYYDAETGFYYLQSRYYDPSIYRFVNADSQVSAGQGLLAYNMFAYCMNNPVNGCDPCGRCFHHWNIFEDCEDCKDKTFKEKAVEAAKEFIDFEIHVALFIVDPEGTIITMAAHYGRNLFNDTYSPEELTKNYAAELPEDSVFHQNNTLGGENKKYVIGDWFSSEHVLYSDGTLNDTPEDRGTFNVYSGDNKFLNITVHGYYDVLPYMIYGNSFDDSTTIIDRAMMALEVNLG